MTICSWEMQPNNFRHKNKTPLYKSKNKKKGKMWTTQCVHYNRLNKISETLILSLAFSKGKKQNIFMWVINNAFTTAPPQWK